MAAFDEVECFRELLRFKTVSAEAPKTGAYRACMEFMTGQFAAIPGTKHEVKEFVDAKPVLIGELPGSDPSLPCLLLIAHYDVVPCEMEKWTVEAFNPRKRDDGRIYARGAQDMKCVLAMYICALRRLVAKGVKLERTIRILFTPDEEVYFSDIQMILKRSETSLFDDFWLLTGYVPCRSA